MSLDLANNFLATTPKSTIHKRKTIDKMVCHQNEGLLFETVLRDGKDWEKIFAGHISRKGFAF